MQSKISFNNNILIKLAIVCYCLFFILFYFSSFEFQNESIYNDLVNLNFAIELLVVVIIAPIFEEFIFRSPIIYRNRIWIIVLFVFSLIYFLFNLPNIELRSLVIFIWSSALILAYFFLKANRDRFVIWSSILAFTLSHLDLENFLSFNTFVLIVFYFAASCLLTWVILKFGLFKSIVFHSTYNLLAISLYLITQQFFFDDTLKKKFVKKETVCIEWQQNPFFESSKSKINYEESQLIVNNGRIRNVLDLITTLSTENYNYIITNDADLKYDIRIYSTKDSFKLNDSIILNALTGASLLKITKKDE